MTATGIHVDLDVLLEEALKGVRRAVVFLGLGVNAATDPTFRKYQLTGITNLQLIPDDQPDEQIAHYKEEFRLWVEAGGFRELVESFSVYLDGVHQVCGLITASKASRSQAHSQDVQNRFSQQGVPNQLNILSQKYNVAPTHPNKLVTLAKARSCFAHRRGLVGCEDINESGVLRVSWLGADMFVEDPDGNQILFDQDSLPIHLPNGGTVNLRMVERVRDFHRGERLLMSARELAEICWFYTREARATLESVIGFAQSQGVAVERK